MKVRDKNKGILLDIGTVSEKQPNFIRMARVKSPGVDIVHDLEKFPWPLESDSCLIVLAAHIAEHIKPWLVIPFMDELWRMLLPNGQLAISAPYAGSPGYWQDPTHCTMITERTWQYFAQTAPLYHHYRPKPWSVEHLAFKVDANIEVILRKIKSDDLIVELTTKALTLGALQKPTELYNFLDFIKGKPLDTVVEIGTAQGGVFHSLCQLAGDNATVVSIDLPGGQFGGEHGLPEQRRLKKSAKKDQTLRFIRGDSHNLKTKGDLLKIIGKEKIDLLFIDGDHSYLGVKKDWEMYSPLVKKGGFVAFHDICFHPQVLACEVERFWKELKPKYKILEFIDPNEQTWGGIGVVEI